MDRHWTIYLQRDGIDEKVPLASFQRPLEGATPTLSCLFNALWLQWRLSSCNSRRHHGDPTSSQTVSLTIPLTDSSPLKIQLSAPGSRRVVFGNTRELQHVYG
ncbi:hypothetical protein [Paraburkholderia aromaticivorans]|uniref:hypothetical protein n=1 Tax=Paraburkholderia aromaticivorans TaxID=2026199 RepID=UPI00145621A1|nr:hypothetical protein [Paraburkholderia aromaticivorans]